MPLTSFNARDVAGVEFLDRAITQADTAFKITLVPFPAGLLLAITM